MVTFSEIINRAYSGPYCTEFDYDLQVFAERVAETVRKHGLTFDTSRIVFNDDDLADRLFEAGTDLFTAVGVYCSDTERIIKFSEDEVHEAIATAPLK